MGDPKFVTDAPMIACLSMMNEVLDRFVDPAWLTWVEPAGLMPATKERVRRQLEEHEWWCQNTEAEARQLAADRQRNEDVRKKQETGKKVAGGSARLARAIMARKGSKVSGLGEELSDSGSAGTANNQAQQTKSEVAKREAHKVWEEMKKGWAPTGYILVSPTLFLSQSLLTTMIGGQLKSMRGHTQEAGVLPLP